MKLLEKDMEDLIIADPQKYLEEAELHLISRQYSIGKYRFDLLFEDRHEGKLIVEIQRGTLDRNHTYKILDYFDEFKKNYQNDFIDLVIIANKIPRERRERLHSYGITFFEIPESVFLEDPNMVKTTRDQNNRSENIRESPYYENAEEELIQISEDSPTTFSLKPEREGTVEYIKYEVLIDNPYKYTAKEFFEEVHFNRRGKKHLKIETYSLKRLGLAKRYGWGIHINKEQKIAMIPCESEKYRSLLNDPNVKKSNAYRTKRKTE